MKTGIVFQVTDEEVKEALEYGNVPVTAESLRKAKSMVKAHLKTHFIDIVGDAINGGAF